MATKHLPQIVEVQVPVVRCDTCDAAYTLVAPITPARWIYEQPKTCKRAKHPLATAVDVDPATLETLPLRGLI